LSVKRHSQVQKQQKPDFIFESCTIVKDSRLDVILFTTPAACRRVETVIPALRVRSVEWLSLFAYPLSGGFQKWSLMPAALVGPVLSLEEKIPETVRRLIAFRMMVVLERVKP